MIRFSFFALVFLIFILSAPVFSSAKVRSRIDNPTLRLAERIAPKYGVPTKLLKAVLCQESSCGENPAPRREHSKSWERKARAVAKSPRHFEQLMHSYGSAQLSGLYTFLEFGIEPKELLEDETNLEIASVRLARELAKCHGSEYCAAARYNGGSRPNKQAREYAKSVLKWKENV